MQRDLKSTAERNPQQKHLCLIISLTVPHLNSLWRFGTTQRYQTADFMPNAQWKTSKQAYKWSAKVTNTSAERFWAAPPTFRCNLCSKRDSRRGNRPESTALSSSTALRMLCGSRGRGQAAARPAAPPSPRSGAQAGAGWERGDALPPPPPPRSYLSVCGTTAAAMAAVAAPPHVSSAAGRAGRRLAASCDGQLGLMCCILSCWFFNACA